MDAAFAGGFGTDHVWKPKGTWSVEIQGSLVRVKMCDGRRRRMPKTKRRRITFLSSQSRQRAFRALARVDWQALLPGQFVSLTYGDNDMAWDRDLRTEQRARIQQYIERKAGRPIPMFWRSEWEVRKSGRWAGYIMPHWHLMVLTYNQLDEEQVRRWWMRIINASEYTQVDVREIYGIDGCARYLVYYVAKSASLDYVPYVNIFRSHGRQWGFHRDPLIPRHPLTVVEDLPEDELEFLKGFARETFAWYGEYGEYGFTMYGKDLADILQNRYGKGVVFEPNCV